MKTRLKAELFVSGCNFFPNLPSICGWIILEWIFRKWDVGVVTALGWLRTETGGGQL
jgi:hypothetical protein